jgi:hypothetical protein
MILSNLEKFVGQKNRMNSVSPKTSEQKIVSFDVEASSNNAPILLLETTTHPRKKIKKGKLQNVLNYIMYQNIWLLG